VDGHVLSFPSPSSSSSPFLSQLPSPVLDGVSEFVGDTSAAEYAAAIMSSAWASDGPSMAQVIPPALLSTENETSPDAEQSDIGLALEEDDLPEPLAYLDNAHSPSRQEAKMGGVLRKMKRISDKFRKLLRGKSKVVRDNGGVNIDVDVRRVGGRRNSPLADALSDVIDIHTSAAQVYDSLLPNHSTDTHLPLPLPPPPGLVVSFHYSFLPERLAQPLLQVRRSRTRPILSSQTYSSSLTRSRTNDNPTEQNTPMIRIRPPSSSSHVTNSNNNVAAKTPSPDLTIHSRPKTLAEIKSKRRLSLSALSNFTRSTSPTPPVNVVTTNRHRTRPTSALAFYPRPPPLSNLRAAVQTDSSATTNHRSEVPRSSRPATATVYGTVRSDCIPPPAPAPSASMALSSGNHLMADAIKKKNRRFSLSAISNSLG
jgi:hypothetical protein